MAAAVSKFQKFVPTRVPRTALKNAPYNPRFITGDKARKLRANLDRVGLIEPVIWNKRTGNLVGGHQRLAALDALERTDQYLLDVSAVDMDDKTEREQNVFLNNPAVQGDWDLRALNAMLQAPDFEIADAGFERVELNRIFFSDVNFSDEVFRPSAPAAPAKPTLSKELVVMFGSRADRERFMLKLGLTADDRYIDSARIFARLGIDTSGDWLAAYAS